MASKSSNAEFMPYAPVKFIKFDRGMKPLQSINYAINMLTRMTVNYRTLLVVWERHPSTLPQKQFVSGIDAVRMERKRKIEATSDWYNVLVYMVQLAETAIKRKGCNLWYSVNTNVFRATINALLIQVVGPEIFERYSDMIMLHMSFSFAKPATIIIMSRQVGKTDTSLLACAIALLACQQQCNIICGCYANTPMVIIRNVGKIVENIVFILENHPGIIQPIFRANGQERVAFEWNGNLREILCRTCDANRSRGINPHIEVMDEALLSRSTGSDANQLEHWTVSTMADATRVVLLLSTPALNNDSKDMDRINPYLANPDKFKRGIVMQGVLVCPDCRARSTELSCRHYLKYSPPWRDTSQLVDQINLAPPRLAEDLTRELFGLAPIDRRALIAPDLVNAFSDRPFVDIDITELAVPFVVLVADPAHGSKRSHFAIMMAVFILRDNLIHPVIIAMDSIDMTHIDHNVLEAAVKEFIRAAVDAFAWIRHEVSLIPFIEDNGGYTTSNSIYNAIIHQAATSGLKVNNHYVLSDVARRFRRSMNDGAVHTDADMKVNGVSRINETLQANALWIAKGFATTCINSYMLGTDQSYREKNLVKRFFPSKTSYVDATNRLHTMLCRQMINLRTVHNKGITAKTTSEPDDLVITLVLLLAISYNLIGLHIQATNF